MLPDDLVGLQVDRRQAAPRRRQARNAKRREKDTEVDAIRRAVHRLDSELGARRMRGGWCGRIVLAARYETRNERDRLRIGGGDLASGVDRDAAPFEHSEIARKHQRTLL